MNEIAKILIVDDEREILESLRRVLSHPSYDLTCTSSPQAAIERLSTESFDLLLCDVEMPHTDGHAVMEQARLLQPAMTRVFLTGTRNMDAAIEAINEGEVFRFLQKPYDVAGLRLVVEQALDRTAELRRATDSHARAIQRRLLYSQLEAEHPGITDVDFGESEVYVVDTMPLTQLAKLIGMQALL